MGSRATGLQEIGAACLLSVTVPQVATMLFLLALISSVGASVPVAHFYSGYGEHQPAGLLDHKVPQPVSPSQSTGQDLPCAGAGFHVNPTDSNRFYRCVDHTGIGAVFTVYEFHCPVGQVFVLAKVDGICVPTKMAGSNMKPQVGGSGSPAGTSSAVGAPTQTGGGAYPTPGGASAQTTVAPPQFTAAPAQTTAVPAQTGGGAYPTPGGASNPVPAVIPVIIDNSGSSAPSPGAGSGSTGTVGGGAYPTPGGGSTGVVGGGAYPSPGASQGASYPSPVTSGCAAQYVQDDSYCNVYRACPDDGKAYRCKTGSVFDQAKQMCRWSYRAADVCAGKQMMSAAMFRSFPVALDANMAVHDPAAVSINSVSSHLGQIPLQYYSVADTISGGSQIFIGGPTQQVDPVNPNVLYLPAGDGKTVFSRFAPGQLSEPILIQY